MPAHWIERVERTCLECGKTFLATRAEVRRGNALYCCSSHRASHTQRTGITMVASKCKNCGIDFVYKAKEKARTGGFCSNKCSARFHGRRRSASVGPFDSKGRNRDLSKKDAKLFKELAVRIGKCEDCAAGGKLHVHHIQEVHKRPDLRWELSNLVVLCVPCHAKRHPQISNWILASGRAPNPENFRECPECKTEFYSKYKTAIWCSRTCRGSKTRATMDGTI